ncbi:MAG: SLBB domain-containing protein [Sulfuritalea sp.]|jgi:protein involved in polysaccharide export with SLBB domain|nr:SLBB domain-containing protein [Sulfuritalea sp.]
MTRTVRAAKFALSLVDSDYNLTPHLIPNGFHLLVTASMRTLSAFIRLCLAAATLSSFAIPALSQSIEDISDSPAAARGLGADVVGRAGVSSAIPAAAPTAQLPALKGATSLTGGINAGATVPERSRPATPPVPNEFQQFLLASTGQRLPLFGQEFFSNPPSTFAPVTDAPVAPDYVVGPGDEVVVRAWGQIDVNLRLTVDRNGMLVIPKVGAVFVGGMRYQEMQGAIHAEVSKVYRNFEMAVTMGQLRGIQIFVVGLANQPGSYTVGSMSTLVNALFAAGGPSSKGSMRRIQVKRANKVVSEFDLYDMLLKGDTSHDMRLRQGDVIVIPPAGPLVAVAGSINMPAVFELKQDGAPLGEVLGYAGGLTTTTRGQKAALERIDGRESRKVAEFNLDGEGLKQPLRDGDLVTLFAISPKFDNAVAVRGFVAQPARHPWREGLRVRDLLPDADAVTSPDYWRARNHTVASGLQLISPQEVSWDYAVIERLKPDATTELMPFNLAAAIIKGDPQHNLLLRPGDILTVLSKSDVRVPQNSQRRYVRLEGEFAASGIYSVRPGETLRQLVARIGGFSQGAYVFGAEFTRDSTRQLQQKQLDESLDRMEREMQRVTADVARNATGEEALGRTAQIAEQKAMITRLRGVKATGRIVLGINADSPAIKDLPDLALEDGDRFYVPPTPSVVSVLGSVFNPNSFVYRESLRADDYLAQAGGPIRSADEGSVYLLRADGTVSSKRQRGWLGLGGSIGSERVMPGDAIVVPEELERVTLTRELKEWSQIFYQFALGVAGLKVLRD